ncbi:MAG: ATP-binding protein [Planctomycetales bacterium]|nr:ATP-binding protein [Planctomycetales bacterium]
MGEDKPKKPGSGVELSPEHLRGILDSMEDAVFVLDREQRHVKLLGRWVGRFGYVPEQFIGRTAREIFEPEAAMVHEEANARALAGETVLYEWEIQGPQGPARFESLLSPVRNPEGVVVAIVAVGRDITQQKRLEAQLVRTQKMEAVGRLAGGIVHDFGNLLTAITGYGELLLRRLPAGDPLRVEIEEIRRAGARATALVRQLLAFTRKQVLQPRVLDLNAALDEMEATLRHVLGEEVVLVLKKDPGNPRVRADRGQLEQAVLNLSANANDAMPDGGTLTLSTGVEVLDEARAADHDGLAAGPHAVLTIADVGVGMPPEVLERAFEPFFTTKDPAMAAGLGLSAVFGIVKQSGGDIRVESEPGKGTTFRVWFPHVEAASDVVRPAAPAEAPGAPEAAASAAAPSGPGETVLVVDDEPSVRALARRVLELNGYEVLEAGGADEAVALCGSREGPIHLVLTDVVSRRGSGPDLAQRLAEKKPGIRVVYMSGYAPSASQRRWVLGKGVPLVEKPLAPETLSRKVRETLGKKK